MTRRLCMAPGCLHVQPGRHSGFCIPHQMLCAPATVRLIRRTSIEIERTADPDIRSYLAEQLQSYIHAAIAAMDASHGEHRAA